MILKSIKLHNIRSYSSQTIDFPTGSTLLTGDIGVGKSTIFLAIEFAFFGTKRKHLSAQSLLRHGAKEGSVELSFDLDDQNYIVKRTLKRGKSDIKQEAGYIIKDGIKKDGMPIELKTEVLSLLGYPQDLISKSRDLVYRYTVYTPQENMKQIILEDKDVRLDTLRKVFNIDKYKRIRENLQILTKALKEKRKLKEGQTQDLPIKLAQIDQRQKDILEISNQVAQLEPRVSNAKQELIVKKDALSLYDDKIKELAQISKDVEVQEVRLANTLSQRKRSQDELDQIKIYLEQSKPSVEQIKSLEVIEKEISDNQELLGKKDAELQDIAKETTILNTKIDQANQTKDKVAKIDDCPLCLQKVTHEHKEEITKKETNTVQELTKQLSEFSSKKEVISKEIQSIKESLDKARKDQLLAKERKIQETQRKEKLQRSIILETEVKTLKEEIGKINVEKSELYKKQEALKTVEQDYVVKKQEFEKVQTQAHQLEIQVRELSVKKKTIEDTLKDLDSEIKSKSKIKEEISTISQYLHWLDEQFIKLTVLMEKHIMLTVYQEFNELFQEWFQLLVEDETLSIRLDDEFSPIVEQNGYETEIENLSGGERTAVALAYRLALNKVINDVIGTIKTKDILMLDEPTDGFSTEQLDKVRDVLEELKIKQILIVSHEQKIESFVDNVIQVSKDQHVSEVS